MKDSGKKWRNGYFVVDQHLLHKLMMVYRQIRILYVAMLPVIWHRGRDVSFWYILVINIVYVVSTMFVSMETNCKTYEVLNVLPTQRTYTAYNNRFPDSDRE